MAFNERLPRNARYATLACVCTGFAVYYQTLFDHYGINFAWEVWCAGWTTVGLTFPPWVVYTLTIHIIRKMYETNTD